MPMSEKRRTKGDILLAVLARIAEGVGDAAALFGAFVEAGYGASYGRIQHVAGHNRAEAGRIERTLQSERKTAHRYRILLSALKRDGLIEERPNKLGRVFVITRGGIEKLAALRKRKKNMLPSVSYEVAKGDAISIVTFDVPERERRKRDWLRAVLRRLDFTPVQKSVWMGKVKIPREFLDDLRTLRLVEFVEIFQITKTGSLKHLT